ncbi:heavy-metal-associated domain-containing protein [Rhizobium sp. EC-SD404]|uniref:heavy-metal-associated domain-containing protein n=1 Tax=Rhizobium sp. EC-SD404 TaxID=2038389 RepID=UPI001251256D|nr:heavy-metal-associated domain-containing protein [Rhizobium sp. EC-SD404]VVT27505.1 Copper chaperone [Rhizobium sp. EC-SD404]
MKFEIEAMHCGGCARGVTKAIQSVDPAASVNVDLDKRHVTVDSSADPAAITAKLDAAGFPPRQLD